MMHLSIGKNGLLLFVFALITAGTLALTYEGTKDTIKASQREAAQKALLEIVPQSRFDNDILTDTVAIPQSAHALLGKLSDEVIHLARKDGKVIGAIVPAIAPDGYNGDIKLITGVNLDGSIAGVRILVHKETPGLGDKVDIKKSQWVTSFNGRSLNNPAANGWNVKKNGGEFDQFTGATITPRAVVTRIHKVLQFVDNNKTLLFDAPQKEAK